MGLRVLITCRELWSRSGTVTYVRDLALELQRQGHVPSILSSPSGSIAAELRATGIAISAVPGRLDRPDIIHAHQHAPTILAVNHWATVPAIHICHDHLSPHDRTPLDGRIRRHFGVSRLCVQRLVEEGVPLDRAALMPNFVDTARFPARAALPKRPRRALVFSNYASEESHLPAVREACLAAGLELDVAGVGVGKALDQPESVLGSYDIVFAKAKAAIEAMAVGCAVVLCDYAGVGPMVTSAEFDALRDQNFGFEALREPPGTAPILREIARYDAADAARVRDLIREHARLDLTVERLTVVYQEVLAEWRSGPRSRVARGEDGGAWRESLFLRLYWAWMAAPPRLREWIKRLPGMRRLLNAVRARM